MEAQYLCLDWVYGEKLIYSTQKEDVFSVNDGFSWAYTRKFTLNTQSKPRHAG